MEEGWKNDKGNKNRNKEGQNDPPQESKEWTDQQGMAKLVRKRHQSEEDKCYRSEGRVVKVSANWGIKGEAIFFNARIPSDRMLL